MYSTRFRLHVAENAEGDAIGLVKNIPGLNGSKGWRNICRRFSDKPRGKRFHLIRICVNPPKIKKLEGDLHILEVWELLGRQ